jgi:hypothetical protein
MEAFGPLVDRIDDRDVGVANWRHTAVPVRICDRRSRILQRHGDDPVVVDAALSGMRGMELAVLERLRPAKETPQ